MKHNFIREILNNSKDIFVFDHDGISNLNFDQMQEFPAFVYLLEQTLYKKIEKIVYNKIKYSIILEDEMYDIEINNNNIVFQVACVVYEQSSNDENSFPALVTLKFDWKINLIEFLVNSNNVDFEVKL